MHSWLTMMTEQLLQVRATADIYMCYGADMQAGMSFIVRTVLMLHLIAPYDNIMCWMQRECAQAAAHNPRKRDRL